MYPREISSSLPKQYCRNCNFGTVFASDLFRGFLQKRHKLYLMKQYTLELVYFRVVPLGSSRDYSLQEKVK